MASRYSELVQKLKEMFQLDQPELDFGIYRILHARADKISDFLENRLKQNVLKSLCEHPEAESDVYSHLLKFFSRYYDKGDFISLRRYKGNTYAIPYSGEEVKLHWANADQYYIKSSEAFSNYSFSLDNGKKVHFKLLAADTAKDNTKDNDGERRFVLWEPSESCDAAAPATFLEEKDDGLYIYFRYVKLPKKPDDETKNSLKPEAMRLRIEQDFHTLGISAVYEPLFTTLAPTEKDKKRSLLEKHLANYIAKNTSDYFIHKNLGAFLRNELDFYIKNEMMHMDDIMDASTIDDIGSNLRKIQTVRTIASELITFMAQLEDFQKKLWLKKKFVVQCDYCVTMDLLSPELRREALENPLQQEEWNKLNTNRHDIRSLNINDYNETVDARIVDTRLYDEKFKSDLLFHLHTNSKEKMGGEVIWSNNIHAMRFLEESYKNKCQLTYTDPPYNSNASEILYKNGYKHSSWISLMEQCMSASKNLLSDQAIVEIAIDDCEQPYLMLCMEAVYGKDNYISTIAINSNPKGREQEFLAKSHDYSLVFAINKKKAHINDFELSEDEFKKKFNNSEGNLNYKELPLKRTGSDRFREDRESMYFPFFYCPDNDKLELIPFELYSRIFNKSTGMFDDAFVEEVIKQYEQKGYVAILPLGEKGDKLRWKHGYEKCKKELEKGEIVCRKNGDKGYNIKVRQYGDKYYTPKTFWFGKEYDASSKGTNLLKDILPDNKFDYPKSIFTVRDNIILGSDGDSFILDFFAGSGTTAHAIINLNRDNPSESKRKYILIEMGEHVNTVILPRLKKIIFSPDWKDGSPVTYGKGLSHWFKYIRLESYEDTLNNLELSEPANELPGFMGEEYLLKYMLDIDSRGSLINVDSFKKPFDYELKITVDSSGAWENRKIDLVETFNYLIGLKVEWQHRRMDKGHVFVEGILPDGGRALVVWRDCEKVDNDRLNDLISGWSSGFDKLANDYSVIYVNGDHSIPNRKLGDEEGGYELKIRSLEKEFLARMFEEE